MMDAGIIEYSDSPYASPVTMMRKRDNTFHMAIHLRAVNKLVKPEFTPLPSI